MPSFFSPFPVIYKIKIIKKRYKTYILQNRHKKIIIQKQWENSTHTQLSNKGKISESTTGDKAMRASRRVRLEDHQASFMTSGRGEGSAWEI